MTALQVDRGSAWDSWAVETCGQGHFTSQWEETVTVLLWTALRTVHLWDLGGLG